MTECCVYICSAREKKMKHMCPGGALFLIEPEAVRMRVVPLPSSSPAIAKHTRTIKHKKRGMLVGVPPPFKNKKKKEKKLGQSSLPRPLLIRITGCIRRRRLRSGRWAGR